MKTIDFLISKTREEKIVYFVSWVSILGMGFGLIFILFSVLSSNPKPIYDTLSALGIGVIFMFPFVLLQFFTSAGLYGKGMGWIYFPFYLILFPFADIWFFSGINVVFDILPTPRRLDLANANMTLEEYQRIAWGYIFGIYILFNGAGLLWRTVKYFFQKRKEEPIALCI